jgi:N-acyl-D-amino-acid deacylase
VPAEVQDRATYRDPHQYAQGMRHVLVNGHVAFRDGKPSGALAGRALRRAPAGATTNGDGLLAGF